MLIPAKDENKLQWHTTINIFLATVQSSIDVQRPDHSCKSVRGAIFDGVARDTTRIGNGRRQEARTTRVSGSRLNTNGSDELPLSSAGHNTSIHWQNHPSDP